MKEPTLIIMAAGMGSRYGGLKQIDPITAEGEIIMDFSLYDAMMAGFKRAVFVIKEEMEEAFRQLIEPGAGKHMDVQFAFQKQEDLPQGYQIPQGRIKPWGTAHAIMSARHLVDGPFLVINADDYYGASAFMTMYEFLEKRGAEDPKTPYSFAMVAYALKNTITENGHVARGVCRVDEEDHLSHIVERKKIMRREELEDAIAFTEDEGATWEALPEEAPVSMNFWGYTGEMMDELWDRFPAFLDENLDKDPLKCEYPIPGVTDQLIKEGKAVVTVLKSPDRWFGVTYKEDKEDVVMALQSMKDKGMYPKKFW
ncbi:MAG: nucleotidyltransferase family protein [Anaerovoracaceae bacterium]|jgi:dTDP-glucose pyrophosphorylase